MAASLICRSSISFSLSCSFLRRFVLRRRTKELRHGFSETALVNWLDVGLAILGWGRGMLLRHGGVDIFYIDESNDGQFYVLTAVAVPFMRLINSVWTIVWPDHLEAAKR